MKMSGYRKKVNTKVFAVLKDEQKFILGYMFIGILLTLSGYLFPFVYQVFIDEILVGGKIFYLKNIIVLFILAFFLKTVLGYLNTYYGVWCNKRSLLKIKNSMFSNILKNSVDWFSQTKASDIIVTLEKDSVFLNDYLEKYFVNYNVNMISLIAGLRLCCVVNPGLTMIAALFSLMSFVIDGKIAKKEKVILNEIRGNNERQINWFQETLSNWKEIKALCMEEEKEKQYMSFLYNHIYWDSKRIYCFASRYLVIPLIKQKVICSILVYFIGGIFVIQGSMTIGEIVSFSSFFSLVTSAMDFLSSGRADLLAQQSMIDRVLCTLQAEKSKMLPVDSTNNYNIRISGLSFSYDNKMILDDVSFSVQEGDRIEISGKSGCGKSTFVKLLAGLIEPQSGIILIGDQPIRNIDEKERYKRICYVAQDSCLFQMSVRENLLLAKSNASEEEMKTVCQLVGLEMEDAAFAEGLDTIVGKEGDMISGGQKQRLILARTLLRDADIYILDEATSHLDRRSEKEVLDNIDRTLAGKTIVYIAHHEDQEKSAAKKIALEAGKLMAL